MPLVPRILTRGCSIPVTVFALLTGCGSQTSTQRDSTAAQASYCLEHPRVNSADWQLVEQVDAADQPALAELDPTLVWYAEYEGLLDTDRDFRLSGHSVDLDTAVDDLEALGYTKLESSGGVALTDGSAVALFFRTDCETLLLLSYDLSLNTLEEIRQITLA